MKNRPIINSEYVAFVTELKNKILSARITAARSVNRELILLYWDIGRGIVERQKTLGWGESVIEMLAQDLKKEFHRYARIVCPKPLVYETLLYRIL